MKPVFAEMSEDASKVEWYFQPDRRWLNHHHHLHEGAVWERIKGPHEPAVRVLKRVTSRIGDRYLVEGLQSRRQWLIAAHTLLDSYRPKTSPENT